MVFITPLQPTQDQPGAGMSGGEFGAPLGGQLAPAGEQVGRQDARAVAARTDSMILYIVNDDYYNDFSGCHYNVVSNATVTAVEM